MVQVLAHSELGASGMHRWSNCPGSVKLSRDVPSFSSFLAEEGTEAHELAANILEARELGKQEPDTFEYDEEMIDMVDVYVDHVIGLKTSKDVVQLFENKFDLSSIFPGCFGTADAVTYYPASQLLVVTDLKYGAGILVDVEDNKQLKYYALGAMVSLGYPVKKVRLEICQPRTWAGDPVSTCELDVFELWEFADELVEAAQRTQLEDTQLAAGGWCQFCPAASAGLCPLVKKQMTELALAKGSLLNYDIPPVDYDQIGKMIKWFPIIKSTMAQMTEFARQSALKGIKIPGTKLVEKKSRRAWKDEEQAKEELSDYLYERDITETKMLSPAKIEDVIAKANETEVFFKTKKEIKEFVTDLTMQTSVGYSLVSENDRRKEAKKISAKSVFTSAEEIDALS